MIYTFNLCSCFAHDATCTTCYAVGEWRISNIYSQQLWNQIISLSGSAIATYTDSVIEIAIRFLCNWDPTHCYTTQNKYKLSSTVSYTVNIKFAISLSQYKATYSSIFALETCNQVCVNFQVSY